MVKDKFDKGIQAFDKPVKSIMISSKIIEQLTSAVARVLPRELSDDVKTNLTASLQAKLSQLGLVTREELEVQEAILEKLRSQLTKLEEKVSILESK